MVFFSRQVGLAVLFVVIGLGAGFWTRGFAQGRGAIELDKVFSGTDLGFRIDGNRGPNPTGSLVVRVDGKWIDVDISSKVRVLPLR